MFMCVFIDLLERRTTDSQVSGSINVNLSASVENDVAIAPFHDQYMRLHEVSRIFRKRVCALVLC